METDIYGSGIQVIIRSDGTVDTRVTGSGDFKVVDQKKNLVSRVILRLLIRKGELESDPNVGSELHNLFGLPARPLTFEWIKILAYDALIRDPAIEDIENLVVTEDPSVKGRVIISGNIKSVTKYKQILDEPHDYFPDQSIYELNKEYIRIITEVKGVVNGSMYYFVQGIDFIQNDNMVEFIGTIRPDTSFLVSYHFYDVQKVEQDTVSFHAPFNLS